MQRRAELLRRAGLFAVLIAAALLVAFAGWYMTRKTSDDPESDVYTAFREYQIPEVRVVMEGREMNRLYGHADRIQERPERADLTVLPEDRRLEVRIRTSGVQVRGLRYEIRNLSGDRLIERTEVEEFSSVNGEIAATLPIQNLLKSGEEYRLLIVLSTGDRRELTYETRILPADGVKAADMLALAEEFSDKSFDAQAARDLTTYLEVDESEDNSTLGYVTLRNNFDMLTWHQTGMRKLGDTEFHLRELQGGMGIIELRYTACLEMESGRRYFDVSENYTMRRGAERIFMMSFTRRVNQIFSGDASLFRENRIMLGITDGEKLSVTHSEDGRMCAFSVNGEVWLHDTGSGLTTRVYALRGGMSDPRPINTMYNAKILQVSAEGDVDFVISGYQNTGKHAGMTGVSYCRYQAADNILSELMFLPSNESAEELVEDTERLAAAYDGTLYILMNGDICRIGLGDLTAEVLVSGVTDRNFSVSMDQSRMAWQDGADPYGENAIHLMDLANGIRKEVHAEAGAVLDLVGFVGNDLVCGLGRPEDRIYADGRVTSLPLYAVEILGVDMAMETRYEKPGIYMSNVSVSGSRVHLERLRKTEGGYEPEDEDTLISNEEIETDPLAGIGYLADRQLGRLYFVQTDKAERQTRIRIPSRVDARENGDIALPADSGSREGWKAYVQGNYAGSYVSFADAVREAHAGMGLVTDPAGHVVWCRVDRKDKADVPEMAVRTAAAERYLAAFREGKRTAEDGTLLLDARGLSLSQVLYFVSRGQPVACSMPDGSHSLLVGYDQFNVNYLWNPGTGESYTEKIGQGDATHYLGLAGNNFICFLAPLP